MTVKRAASGGEKSFLIVVFTAGPAQVSEVPAGGAAALVRGRRS